MENKSQQALQNFEKGFSCAQSVMLAFNEELGVEREVAIRLASPFGGGMGRLGHTCGALSAGLLVLGLRQERQGEIDPAAQGRLYEAVRTLFEEFEERHGSSDCRSLIGLDIRTVKGMEAAKQSGCFKERCPQYLRSVVELVEELKAG